MSPTQIAAGTTYTPTSDAIDRHEYGVNKHRKSASTGGGRAWSDDEVRNLSNYTELADPFQEVYLLQTRLQKMPYKHIAAHLKKTELACRLHYHQLSHGSNRRKRTASVSSVSSEHSPIMASLAPSPDKSRSLSPPISNGSYDASRVQLPSIMEAGRLPVILPKPASLGMSQGPHGYATERQSLPPVSFRESSAQPPLRLDCSGRRPSIPSHSSTHVEMARLQSIYAAYRNTFWAAIAHEYGANATPAALEQAWKTGMCCSQRAGSPITPVDSPDDEYMQDKTRISTILGPEATPRSARDRDMVRRIEGERFST